MFHVEHHEQFKCRIRSPIQAKIDRIRSPLVSIASHPYACALPTWVTISPEFWDWTWHMITRHQNSPEHTPPSVTDAEHHRMTKKCRITLSPTHHLLSARLTSPRRHFLLTHVGAADIQLRPRLSSDGASLVSVICQQTRAHDFDRHREPTRQSGWLCCIMSGTNDLHVIGLVLTAILVRQNSLSA